MARAGHDLSEVQCYSFEMGAKVPILLPIGAWGKRKPMGRLIKNAPKSGSPGKPSAQSLKCSKPTYLLSSGLYRRLRSLTGSCACALAGFTADRELGLCALTLPRRHSMQLTIPLYVRFVLDVSYSPCQTSHLLSFHQPCKNVIAHHVDRA
jgi:hypothetical protein